MKKFSLLGGLLLLTTIPAHSSVNRGTICIDEQDTIHMNATAKADYYIWREDGKSTVYKDSAIVCPVKEGVHTYIVTAFDIHLDPQRNLMDNGDFENGKDGKFSSDYTFYDYPSNDGNFYDSHPNYKNLYTITSNAKKFWRDFLAIKPHGGSKYALFDAGDGGYAWRTSTDINPNLQLVKDSVYAFSFWVACPNEQQYFGTGAELQFVICWKDSLGVVQPEVNLGPAYKTKVQTDMSKAWVQVTADWTSPVDATWVQIGVYDKTTGVTQGNDFCLDDIIFQKVAIRTDSVVAADTITYFGRDCSCNGEPMYKKWSQNDEVVVFVANTDYANPYVAYQWYVSGKAVQGATDQYYRFTGEQLQYEIHAVMTCQDGTTKQTCPTAIAEIPSSYEQDLAPTAPKRAVESRTYSIGPAVRIIQIFYEDGSSRTEKIVETN